MKQKQLEIVQALQNQAIELGRTPTREEFLQASGRSRYNITSLFGNWVALVHAAGLQGATSVHRKIDNTVFEVDIEEHLEYQNSKIDTLKLVRTPYPKIAVLGDIHEPFSHEKVKADFVLFVKEMQPEYVIQVGDSFDQYSNAKFPRSHNVFTPKDEETKARKNLEEFWSEIRKASPNSKLVMLCGNHCLRPIKRVLESVPSIEHWAEKYFKELMTFDGVHTQIDPREEYIIGNIAFLHGYRSKLGDHRDFMLMNAVVGHTHQGGVTFRHIKGETLWELNAGLAGNPDSKGLSYTNQRMQKWTLGWGYIDAFGPRFIPLK